MSSFTSLIPSHHVFLSRAPVLIQSDSVVDPVNMLHIQGCYLQKFVCQFLCVNFAYPNSYVHNAAHKTFFTKNCKNCKYVHKYMHSLSCHTRENFHKDSELVKLPCHLVLEITAEICLWQMAMLVNVNRRITLLFTSKDISVT